MQSISHGANVTTTPGADVRDEKARAEHVTNKLHSEFAAYGSTCLLVVDPSLRALADNPVDGALFSKADHVPVPVEHPAFPPEHRPCMIELDLSTESGAALLAESVRVAFADRRPDSVARGHGQRIGGWLAGTTSLQDVIDHWAVHLPQVDDLGRQCILRFYDARVLSLMWPMLSSSQRRCLLGPVRAWYALDACAELAAYTEQGRAQPSLELEDAQWLELRRHGVVNRALALFMNDVERQPGQREIEAAVEGAARAERHGLLDHQDKIAFVGHALAWHPHFDAHPAMAPVLEKVSQGDLYSAAVSELDSRVADDIRRGDWFKAPEQPGSV